MDKRKLEELIKRSSQRSTVPVSETWDLKAHIVSQLMEQS